MAKIKTHGTTNEIIKGLIDEISTSEGRARAQDGLSGLFKGLTADQAKVKAVEAIRAVGVLVDRQAPGANATDFKKWLGSVSQGVAEAAKEGGFMGFGGTAVSDAEKAVLKDIAGALGLNA